MNDRVTIRFEDGIADVRLNRPDKMNALDPAMIAGIEGALAALRGMAGLRAVVLSGEGRAFCAGLDMASFATVGEGTDLMARSHGVANLYQHVALGWRELPVPVVAAVHGVAFGGGFQIMLGADIRITAPDTRLSIMEIRWGLVPDMSGVALMRGLARDDVVRELTYSGRQFDGGAALGYGFATRLSVDPHGEALALAREIASKSPDAVRAAKRLYNGAADLDQNAILLAESAEQAAVLRQPNQIEAVMANMEKRAPSFRD
ncbi:MAG: enoyl-CoA hydratase [Sphingomonas sp. SCN 67-18]|uniref:crotonase/enoyl-CoA hydratase family protein n=1 Tax=uncultured Sphingomonas sp. TaxID=158754 RepID=UPI00086BE268|nr:crotonase/enoyl-CoA hydratase family protein [Sphingomonas sp. SCN 67-18]ODU22066.1 MAG: enoyl-CoA hydratase [Sphingomonas sp. SCN 67-18]